MLLSLMELKLLGSKSVSASLLFQNGGTTSSSFRHGVSIRFSPQLCSCRGNCNSASLCYCLKSVLFCCILFNSFLCSGVFPRVSENSYLCKIGIGSSDQENLVKGDYVYRINEVNGAGSSIFSRNLRVLGFFDDEYDGVVVDPKRLPSDPDAFASILRFSLTHWRRMVNLFNELRFFCCLVDDVCALNMLLPYRIRREFGSSCRWKMQRLFQLL